jgi:acyl-CoA dehydrogenase
VDQVFDVLVRDFSRYALELLLKPSCSEAQRRQALAMIRQPAFDGGRYDRVWATVHGLADAYEMNP